MIIREHIPITNLFTCLWFNEVDRFTARDQLSFSTVRDKIMSKVSWSINMFLDCERRNFVIQVIFMRYFCFFYMFEISYLYCYIYLFFGAGKLQLIRYPQMCSKEIKPLSSCPLFDHAKIFLKSFFCFF